MKKLLMLLTLLLNFSCSNEGEKPQEPESINLTDLKNKYELYIRLMKGHQDQDGFILTHECDSLMASSLVGTASRVSVNIEATLDSSGKWHRRPLSYEECYPNHSKSSISRDMFTGVFWYIWVHKRLDLAEEIWNYGNKNNWIMGEGDITRTFINPSFKATLARLIFFLGGEDKPDRYAPDPKAKVTGFEAQLAVLLIALNGEMHDGISKKDLDVLEFNYKRVPRNALFSYVYAKYTDGNYGDTLTTLMDENIFPNDRLPNSFDRSTDWLWSRDYGSDWVSGEVYREHTGADFVFMASLLIREMEK